MIDGSCHCGAVKFSYPQQPEWLTSCNCSICRRLAGLWAYAPRKDIEIECPDDATIAYVHGDRTLEMHTCRSCGCTTYWLPVGGDENSRMAVNFRLCDPDVVAGLRIRHFDGADSWQFLD